LRTPVPIDITLKPSRYWLLFASLVAGLAALAVARLPLSPPLMIVLLLVLYGYRVWRRHLVARACTRLGYQGEQWWLVINGEQTALQLRHATTWQCLVSLGFTEADTTRSHRLVLLPDSCSADDLRRLRVLLRHFPVFS
jgi:hypothetical protein